MANPSIHLRDITPADLPVLFEQQFDPEANLLAGFPARDREAFFEHWNTKVLASAATTGKIVQVVVGEQLEIAGYVLSWLNPSDGTRMLGYWLGRSYWGKGIASKAVAKFLSQYQERPIQAFVAKHNTASSRILERCGFVVMKEFREHSVPHGREIEVLEMVLDA